VKDGEQYISTSVSSIKRICENIQVGEQGMLFDAINVTNFSFKPKQFLTYICNKYWNGVWESGDDYTVAKLYSGFKDISENLNIINYALIIFSETISHDYVCVFYLTNVPYWSLLQEMLFHSEPLHSLYFQLGTLLLVVMLSHTFLLSVMVFLLVLQIVPSLNDIAQYLVLKPSCLVFGLNIPTISDVPPNPCCTIASSSESESFPSAMS
jgi:hypothetical protein